MDERSKEGKEGGRGDERKLNMDTWVKGKQEGRKKRRKKCQWVVDGRVSGGWRMDEWKEGR